jgi:hypothetical protein
VRISVEERVDVGGPHPRRERDHLVYAGSGPKRRLAVDEGLGGRQAVGLEDRQRRGRTTRNASRPPDRMNCPCSNRGKSQFRYSWSSSSEGGSPRNSTKRAKIGTVPSSGGS